MADAHARTRRSRRAAPRGARLQAGAEPRLVAVLELRDLVLDHLGPRGLLHDSTGRRGRSAGRSRSRGAGRSSAIIILTVGRQHVRAHLGVPDRRRPLLVGPQARRPGLVAGSRAGSTWSASSASSRRWTTSAPFFMNSLFGLWGWDLGFINFADDAHVLAEIFWLFALILRRARPDQHLLVPPGGAVQQHLGVLARDRRGGDHRHPDLRPRQASERRLRLHRADQQLRLRAMEHVLVVRPARRVPAHACTRSPATTPPRTSPRRRDEAEEAAAKGVWQSVV